MQSRSRFFIVLIRVACVISCPGSLQKWEEIGRREGGEFSMQRILSCTPPPSANVTGTFCVQASPNPEFANSPSNFAHWFFAHVYPMVAALTATGVPAVQIFRARILIGHGNNRVFPRWSTHYRELLGGGICHGGRAALPQWPAACTAEVRIATPIFSFRNRSFYPTGPWRSFAHALRLSPC